MKLERKHKILIIIILLIILLVVGVVLFLNSKKIPDKRGNYYNMSDEVIELPDTVTYENSSLSSKHCLKDICINDAVFYYNNEVGRVEYTITNTSNKVVSGYLKMVFKDQSLIVIYKNLGPKKTIKSSSQYMGIEIKDKSDYKLVKLNKKEIKKIIK